MEEELLIRRLKKHDIKAYKILYDTYAPRMMYLLYRYVRLQCDVDELLQDGFMIIFNKIQQFEGKGSFEGWIKRIFINLALSYLRKNKVGNQNHFIDIEHCKDNFLIQDDSGPFDGEIIADDLKNEPFDFDAAVKANITDKELIDLLDLLPVNYRIVFDLHIIDNYKHNEIAEMLNISENTSKSRLFRAKGIIKNEIQKIAIERLTTCK